MLDLLLAMIAGAVTVAGPCILPLLPVLMGTGAASRHPLRPLAIVLGFTVSFSLFVFLLTVFGSVLGVSSQTWNVIGGAAIAVFGLVILLPKLQTGTARLMERLSVRVQSKKALTSRGLLSGFVVGATLGLVWSPCSGPVLGAITALIVSRQQLVHSAFLLLAFAVGAGLPMLLVAYGGQYAVSRVRSLSRHAVTIQRVFGTLMVLSGLAIVFGLDRSFMVWINVNFPGMFFGPGGPRCLS